MLAGVGRDRRRLLRRLSRVLGLLAWERVRRMGVGERRERGRASGRRRRQRRVVMGDRRQSGPPTPRPPAHRVRRRLRTRPTSRSRVRRRRDGTGGPSADGDGIRDERSDRSAGRRGVERRRLRRRRAAPTGLRVRRNAPGGRLGTVTPSAAADRRGRAGSVARIRGGRRRRPRRSERPPPAPYLALVAAAALVGGGWLGCAAVDLAARGGEREPCIPAAWITWATVRRRWWRSRRPTRSTCLVIVAVAWFVYAAQRVPGPTARSFRVFLIAGPSRCRCARRSCSSARSTPSNVAFAALGGAPARHDPGGLRDVQRGDRSVRRGAAGAAAVPRAGAGGGAGTVDRSADDRDRCSECARPSACAGSRRPRFRSLPALAVPVLETGMEDAVTLAESMDARGHGRGRGPGTGRSRGTPAAVVTACAALVAAVVFVVGGVPRRVGGLHPSTFPLAWPEVEPWLLAADRACWPSPACFPRRREAMSTSTPCASRA